MGTHSGTSECANLSTEFAGKRDNALSTNERLQQEAQAVLNVIENPEVAQSLRQDKNQNLQYLKDHYNVCFRPNVTPMNAHDRYQ